MKPGTYHLRGGPADGQHVEVDADLARDGGGIVYVDDDEQIIGRYIAVPDDPFECVLEWKPEDA